MARITSRDRPTLTFREQTGHSQTRPHRWTPRTLAVILDADRHTSAPWGCTQLRMQSRTR